MMWGKNQSEDGTNIEEHRSRLTMIKLQWGGKIMES